MFISKPNGQKFPTWVSSRKISFNDFFLANDKAITFIRECFLTKVKFISINIYLVITESHVRGDIYIPNTLHGSNVIIDLTNPKSIKLLSLESSITGGSKYLVFENTYGKGLEKIFNKIFNKTITYVSFDKDTCPRFDIQGDADTCAYWSIYLFYMYILNDGDRTKIYRILQKVDVKYRNRILSQFIYYIYNNIVKPRKCSLQSSPNPRLEKDLLVFREVWDL